MKTDVHMLELWNRGVSERLLFNVKMSNSSAISWRDRLQFVELMMVLQSKYCLFVPASLMYFYCNIPFQTFIKDTPKTATSSETRLSAGDILLIRSIKVLIFYVSLTNK
jgi:hypothetical protein